MWKEIYKSAIEKGLDHDPQWLHLLHYHRHFGKLESDIDGGYFFLSTNGKKDSRAELEATIRALFTKEDLSPPLDSGMEVAAMHPLCKFRARLRFLKERLGFADSLLPDVDCGRFLKWKASLNPQSVSLIFASSYLNNPASVFGHTFLRLNTYAAKDNRAILNYGITYSAAVPEGEGAAFIYKGVFGKYRGSYGIVPYFVSLQKYSNLESRDIWEYELKLDPNQINYLLEHVWEVGACWMDYYFFDENCSYNIITLIDAIDPEFKFAESLDNLVVVPAETIKLIILKKNLIAGKNWRPSLLNTFKNKVQNFKSIEKKYLKKVLTDQSNKIDFKESGLPNDTIAQIFDAALDYIQYYKRRSKPKNLPAWEAKQRQLLLLRANLPAFSDSQDSTKTFNPPPPPESSHKSHLFSLSIGSENYLPYSEIGYRLAYHDFNANENGFLNGSQVETIKIQARIYCEVNCSEGINHIELNKFDIINLISISPMDFIQHPWSWSLRVGYEKVVDENQIFKGNLLVDGGMGASTLLNGKVDMLPYILIQARISDLIEDGWRPNVGPMLKTGGRISISKMHSFWVQDQIYLPLLENRNLLNEAMFEYRFSTNKNGDLRIKFLHQNEIGSLSATWNTYF